MDVECILQVNDLLVDCLRDAEDGQSLVIVGTVLHVAPTGAV